VGEVESSRLINSRRVYSSSSFISASRLIAEEEEEEEEDDDEDEDEDAELEAALSFGV